MSPNASSPAGVLRAAVNAVPAVKYALGVAGLAAAAALATSFFAGRPLVALLASAAMLVLMVLLVLFAKLASTASKTLAPAVLFMTWAILLLVIISAGLLVSSLFFDWPKPLAALLAPQVATLPSHSGLPQRPTNAETLKPAVEYLGYADGSGQYDTFGCPNGELFAMLSENRNRTISIPDDRLNQEARLGPVDLVLSLDTDLPRDDYVLVSGIDVAIVRYTQQPDRPALLINSTPCADADPASETTAFLAILSPSNATLPLLRPTVSARDVRPLVVRQDQPAVTRIHFTARQSGWYTFTVAIKYRYRGDERLAEALPSTTMYIPSPVSFDWYHSNGDGHFELLPDASAERLVSLLDRSSADGFPARLPTADQRSGLIDDRATSDSDPRNDKATELDLMGVESGPIPVDLYDKVSLLRLVLVDRQLESIPDEMRRLSQLQELNLSVNRLTEIPHVLFTLKSLKSLQLGGNAIRVIPSGIASLTQLEQLSLGDMLFGGNQIRNLPSAIRTLTSLQDLALAMNPLIELPAWLGELKALRSLNIMSTLLQRLPDELGALSELQELHVDGTPLAILPDSIGRLSKLRELTITETALSRLPESVENLKALETLSIDGTVVATLPRLGALPAFKSLYINAPYATLSAAARRRLVERFPDSRIKVSFKQGS